MKKWAGWKTIELQQAIVEQNHEIGRLRAALEAIASGSHWIGEQQRLARVALAPRNERGAQ